MKKILLIWSSVYFLAGGVWAADRPALSLIPAPGATQTITQQPTRSQLRKQFKERRKLIRKLVKEYHKSSEQEQAVILAQLEQVVSEGTDAGLAYVKERIAAERLNLDSWEAKVKQDEANLDQIKKNRVAELLAKDAKKKHKARRKAWKKQLREAHKKMR